MRRFASFLLLSLGASLARAESISYQEDVQPILTYKCVACHACYDAPCQLNLGSAEGLERGASQQTVYDGSRMHAQETTRLFLDAHGEQAWRKLGFNSVVDDQNGQAALLKRMLELGREQPLAANAKLPKNLDISIDRDNSCPLPGEFEAYAKKHPLGGMPFAVSGLSDEEYALLNQWLEQGGSVDQKAQSISEHDQAYIQRWEHFLNQQGLREQLVARWLYEHMFLAHIYFDQGQSGQFYQLVRSRTPAPEPIEAVARRRPNDDPGTEIYYRLRPINDVIVHKTHITLGLDDQKLAKVQAQFLADDWTLEQLPGYGTQRRANPFETFAAIPAQARYQFMLDNAEYFVRTFIRGPVCRGQIATDVIRDNFWVMFQNPEHDLYITDAEYREQATPFLSMPGQLDHLSDTLGLWHAYRDKRNDYENLRRDRYADADLANWDVLWSGNENALLTVFRQHDSASVRKGLVGEVPQTFWLMDYPLLERTYYQLVVNFDVFGNVSHQMQTRLYFDLIRNGSEVNFLRLMPADTRKSYLSDWYQDSGKIKAWLDYAKIDSKTASDLNLTHADAKGEFAEQLLERFSHVNARPDWLNRCKAGQDCHRPNLSPEMQQAEQALSRLTGKRAGDGLPVIKQMPEATLIRVEQDGGERQVYSLLRNRAHSNVAFMLGEGMRYQPKNDTLTLVPEVMSSYPNFIFSLKAQEVPEFVQAMEQVKKAKDFERVADQWGIRRTHPQFWQHFHDLTRHIEETQPLEAGVLDMNRYENL